MAKKSTKQGDSLVIVESPAKAKTIKRFLGPGFQVEASIGHVRDLPSGAKEVPEEFKKEEWAYLGVNVNDGFQPVYIVPPEKKKQVAKLKAILKECKDLYLATDEDREGEAISWHLFELLNPKVPVHRLVFHEITKEAIQAALANPRDIDEDLVQAQEARRILDRLYGYEVSPLLWRKVKPKLSAGRVQSVAVRLIVERERERMKFVSSTWWDLLGLFAKQKADATFEATMISLDDRKLPAGKDFDSTTGKLKNEELLLLDEKSAGELVERLRGAEFRVTSLEEKPYTRKPSPPFTTSTMQQEANRKLGFGARRAMQVAQSLYENGHITYMRTDSTTLASVAVDAARDLVRSEYGADYLPDAPRVYASKVKNAQEAHEAIRPAGHPFETPAALKSTLSADEFRLFELIWKRTIASQMRDARGRTLSVTIEGGGAAFRVTGRTIDFPGFLRAYVEGSDDPQAALENQEKILPPLVEGEVLDCRELEAKDHTTQPPARFTEASITAGLEGKGIGRPSTYASIIETILARNYVFKKGNALVPTWTAFSVITLMERHLPRLIDYDFTASMEDELDAVSRGELEHVKYLDAFYFGDGSPGLKKQLDHKIEEIDARETSRFLVGKPESGENTEEIFVRVGRYGPFLEQGERRASIRDDMPPDEITLAVCVELLDRAAQGDEPLGSDPETGKPVYFKEGRFGPYVQMGSPDDDEKPKNASLLPGMEPGDINLEVALKLLSLPRVVGDDPKSGDKIEAFNGRYGPYIKCGSETRSLPAEISPLDVTPQQAVELLAQPKRGGRGAAKEPLKTFAESPVTGDPIRLLEGRYGPYVTDGQTNASLPKGVAPEEFTFEKAVEILAERAAAGGGKKKKAKKKAAKKKTTKKKAAKKKAKTKKKAAKKKT